MQLGSYRTLDLHFLILTSQKKKIKKINVLHCNLITWGKPTRYILKSERKTFYAGHIDDHTFFALDISKN